MVGGVTGIIPGTAPIATVPGGDGGGQIGHHGRMSNTPAAAALERLKQGNQRFIEALAKGSMVTELSPLRDAQAGQRPFAIVIGCSDSRVPVEIVFDQGLGDLFVIRVAGNVVAPSQVGSVEFAADQFGTRLVLVLGHTGCGAVAATLEQLGKPEAERSPNLDAIVSRIRPGLLPLLEAEPTLDPIQLAEQAVRANIHATTRRLARSSDILQDLIRNDGLKVVGAEYCLATGAVTFLEDS